MAELLHLGDSVLFEHRLDAEALRLHDPPLMPVFGSAVGDAAKDLFLGLRASSKPRLLLEFDRLAFDLVDDRVDARLMGQARRMTAQRLPIDDERHLDDLRVG